MDRLSFIQSINGIYPEMLVDFFDHFIVLKQLVNDKDCTVNVLASHKDSIEFDVIFSSPDKMQTVLHEVNRSGSVVMIYNRTMTVHIEVLTDKEITIKLY